MFGAFLGANAVGDEEDFALRGLMRWGLIFSLFLMLSQSAVAQAQVISLRGETVATEEPLPTSLLVTTPRLTVRAAPSGKSKRHGTVVGESRLPVLAREVGPGCSDNYWYRIGDNSWVCGRFVQPDDTAPEAEAQPPMRDEELMPWPYAFVHENAIEYERFAGGYREVREVMPGYGFAIERSVYIDGDSYYRTVEGRYVPQRAARVTRRISTFSGVAIRDEVTWPVGWVNRENAWSFSEPSLRQAVRVERLARYTQFSVQERRTVGKHVFYRIDETHWVHARDVQVATTAPLPDSVDSDDRWIDVDLANQIVTAYEGERPVWATLPSTGRGGASRTPKGSFRVWAKVAAIPMDNTDDEPVDETLGEVESTDQNKHYYSLHDVPWTLFFHQGYAIHGVYWHNRFGNRRSSGCVNLAPKDARWLFDWSLPVLPDGWWAIPPVAGEPSTLVRVR